MAYGTRELQQALADRGEDLLFSGGVVKAFVNEGDTVVPDTNGVDVLVRGTSAEIVTADKPAGLVTGVEIERDETGVTYEVRDVRLVGDGGVTLLVLARA